MVFYYYYFFTGVQLFYTVVLVSAIQQSESALHMRILKGPDIKLKEMMLKLFFIFSL